MGLYSFAKWDNYSFAFYTLQIGAIGAGLIQVKIQMIKSTAKMKKKQKTTTGSMNSTM